MCPTAHGMRTVAPLLKPEAGTSPELAAAEIKEAIAHTRVCADQQAVTRCRFHPNACLLVCRTESQRTRDYTVTPGSMSDSGRSWQVTAVGMGWVCSRHARSCCQTLG